MDVGEFHVRVTLRNGDLVFAGEDAVFVCVYWESLFVVVSSSGS